MDLFILMDPFQFETFHDPTIIFNDTAMSVLFPVVVGMSWMLQETLPSRGCQTGLLLDKFQIMKS